jgi:lysophospholipase L1-like esterase
MRQRAPGVHEWQARAAGGARRVRAKILLMLAGTLAGLLLAEAAVRLLGLGPPAPRRVVYAGRSADWCCGPEIELDGVHRFVPGSSFAHCYEGVAGGDFDAQGCVTYHINAQGYRGAGFSPEKAAGAYRIVILGDSFTFGEGTPDPLIYPALLGAALRERLVGGRRVEVVNLGVPGQDLRGALVTYHEYARTLEPDWVVLQWNTNDFPSAAVQRDHLRLIGVRYLEAFARAQALRWSELLSLVYMRIQMGRVSRELIAVTREDAEASSHGLRAIGRLRQMAARSGARFTVLAFPELIRFDDYPYANVLELLREYCAAERIHLVDLLPALSTHRDEELWVHETDHHPNRVAHAIAARELQRAIEAALAEPSGAAP